MQLSVISRVQNTIPALPDCFVPRKGLVTDCLDVLDRTGFIVLSGSMGMGKTTLAKLLAEEAGDWLWVNLSAIPREGISYVLRSLGEVLDGDSNLCNVLLDDVDLAPDACRDYEASLGGLMMSLYERKGRVIITSQREPSQRLQRALSLSDENVRSVPALDEGEIASLIASYNFSKGAAATARLAKVVCLQTSGHPQLVLASIKNYADADWPEVDIETLLKTPDGVIKEKRDARQILAQDLSSSEKTLIYQLSIIGIFRRDQAVMVGQLVKIQNPGDVFDCLVGPWIEAIIEDYYRVSPLIANAAIDALAPAEVQTIRYNLAEAVLAAGKLSQHEAGSIFMHAFMGKNARVLIIASNGILTSDEVVQEAVFNDISWFLACDPPKGALLFPDNTFINTTLRMLQFRIAVSVNPSKAEHIAERWDEELVYGDPKELFLLQRMLYVSQLLLYFQAPISPIRLVAGITEMEELFSILPECYENMKALELPREVEFPEFDLSDPVKFFFGLIASRCSGPVFLEELMTEVGKLPTDLRNRLLSIFSDSEGAAMLLIDHAWLAETNLEAPDWESCLAVFDCIKAKGISFGIQNLAYAAARGAAIICDEYLNDEDRALSVIDAVDEECGVSVITQDSRATVLYNHERFEEALAVWGDSVEDPDQRNKNYDVSIWTARKVGISAARVGDWSKAAELFMFGYRKGQQIDVPWCTVGFLGDAAFAHWMAGEYPDMLECFHFCLQLLDELPDSRENFPLFVVEKMVANVFLWINGELDGVPDNKRNKPYAGLCSDPEPNEKLRDLPPVIRDYLWLFLVELEHKLSLGDEIYDASMSRLEKSSIVAIQLMFGYFQVSRSVQRAEYISLPDCLSRCARLATICRSSGDGNAFVESVASGTEFDSEMSQAEIEYVTGILLGALVSAVAQQKADDAICVWGDIIRIEERLSYLLSFLDEVESVFASSSDKCRSIMRDSAEGWCVRTLSALRVAVDLETSPDELFNAHGFIISGLRSGVLGKDAIACAVEIVADGWLRVMQCPALLRSPRISVPPLKSACGSDSKGIQKFAEILVAASDVISMRIPNEVINSLKDVCNADN